MGLFRRTPKPTLSAREHVQWLIANLDGNQAFIIFILHTDRTGLDRILSGETDEADTQSINRAFISYHQLMILATDARYRRHGPTLLKWCQNRIGIFNEVDLDRFYNSLSRAVVTTLNDV